MVENKVSNFEVLLVYSSIVCIASESIVFYSVQSRISTKPFSLVKQIRRERYLRLKLCRVKVSQWYAMKCLNYQLMCELTFFTDICSTCRKYNVLEKPFKFVCGYILFFLDLLFEAVIFVQVSYLSPTCKYYYYKLGFFSCLFIWTLICTSLFKMSRWNGCYIRHMNQGREYLVQGEKLLLVYFCFNLNTHVPNF